MLGVAGIDFVKDDELQADSPHSPFKDRVTAVMRVINELADRTGKKIMFAFNLTDDLEAMLRHHDTVVAAGGTPRRPPELEQKPAALDWATSRGRSDARDSCRYPGMANKYGVFGGHGEPR